MGIGLAATIKPQVVLLGVAAAVLAATTFDHRRRKFLSLIYGAALLAPAAACVIFLQREQSLGAFAASTRRLVVFHALLGRHSTGFLVAHAIPAQMIPLVLVAAWAAWKHPVWAKAESLGLLTGAAFGFFSFVLQGKAYSYHRATLVAFLLCWAMVQLVDGAGQASRQVCWPSVAALAFAFLWLAPASTVRALRWDSSEPTLTALRGDLEGLVRADPGLANRGIQCLDTTAGCITVLDRMQLVQATGFLYDCYFFAPGGGPVVDEQRARFRAAIHLKLPAVFVVTDQYCFGLPSSYTKLDRWPELKSLLAKRYTLVEERAAPEMPRRWLATWPFGYRIYTLRQN